MSGTGQSYIVAPANIGYFKFCVANVCRIGDSVRFCVGYVVMYGCNEGTIRLEYAK